MDETRLRIQPINRLADVAGHYQALFCDVWGVVHDGLRKSSAAETALLAAREAGVRVILLTNSPRLADSVIAQLDGLAFSRDAYDAVVTSGDATQALIRQGPRRIFHLGPERDLGIFEGLGVERVGEADAEAVVATGLFHDERETPEDYRELLARLHARKLPMICANPDVVVHRGERLIYCAGALAEAYVRLGGRAALAGKPHPPIYEVAAAQAGAPRERILCIGDGLFTDIKGANAFGADALFVVQGIHGEEFAGFGTDSDKLSGELARRDLAARYSIASLA